jgi:hypothetical protein
MARAKADATGMKFERPAAVAAFVVASAPGLGGLLWKRLQMERRDTEEAEQ